MLYYYIISDNLSEFNMIENKNNNILYYEIFLICFYISFILSFIFLRPIIYFLNKINIKKYLPLLLKLLIVIKYKKKMILI
jgi:hypothetical protein